ncbi:MAG TPA: type II toxin-antitoxin system RelE/ParE family toxin [Candidatus Acidoferrum sp.]
MALYELSPEALDDLLNTQEFVSSDSPAAAERLIDEFFAAFEHLASWPRSGHSRADLTEKPVLFWPVGSYLIVYRIRSADSLLQVVAVLLGARDVPAILINR